MAFDCKASGKIIKIINLSPSIRKYGHVFTHSGLSAE